MLLVEVLVPSFATLLAGGRDVVVTGCAAAEAQLEPAVEGYDGLGWVDDFRAGYTESTFICLR